MVRCQVSRTLRNFFLGFSGTIPGRGAPLPLQTSLPLAHAAFAHSVRVHRAVRTAEGISRCVLLPLSARAHAPPTLATHSLQCLRTCPTLRAPCATPRAPPGSAPHRSLLNGDVIEPCGRHTLPRGGRVLRGGATAARLHPAQYDTRLLALTSAPSHRSAVPLSHRPPHPHPHTPQMRLLAFKRSLSSRPAGEHGVGARCPSVVEHNHLTAHPLGLDAGCVS